MGVVLHWRAFGCPTGRRALPAGRKPDTAVPDQFAKQIAEDRTRWGEVIKQIGLKPE